MSEARTLEERVPMVQFFSKYENAHGVQRQWKNYFNTSPPVSTTMMTVNQQFNEIGSVANLPCVGRPSTILTEKLQKIQYIVDSNSRLSYSTRLSTSRY